MIEASRAVAAAMSDVARRDFDQIEAALEIIAWYVACASPGESEPSIVRKVKDARLALARLRAQPQPTATAVPAETATDEYYWLHVAHQIVHEKCHAKLGCRNECLALDKARKDLTSLRSELSSLREQNERLRQCLREAIRWAEKAEALADRFMPEGSDSVNPARVIIDGWRSALAEAGDKP